MSERTSPALARTDELLPLLRSLPPSPGASQVVEEAEALRRAIAAFHMEAIRFRMFSVERLLRGGLPPSTDAGLLEQVRTTFDTLRAALEAAGFHTRSHTAP